MIKELLLKIAEMSILTVVAIILLTIILPFWLLQDLAAGRKVGEIK